MLRRSVIVVLSVLALVAAGAARSAGDPSVAALQTGLYREGFYRHTIDGYLGPATHAAIRRLQRRAAQHPDGLPGRRTRRLLGIYGRPPIGRRVLVAGLSGWDVAALQFMLAWHGFPSGAFDGSLGPRTDHALRRFQRWAGLVVDGRAGPATLAALRNPPTACPLALAYPVQGPLTSGFGPRGDRFHEGIDLAAPLGTPVGAARSGRVTWAGYLAGGWGNLVVVNNGSGVRTMYAHLSRVTVRVGRWVEVGQTVGLVGATGHATGPHVHFEVRWRGAAVNPLAALP